MFLLRLYREAGLDSLRRAILETADSVYLRGEIISRDKDIGSAIPLTPTRNAVVTITEQL